jgi:hypothetical protein
LLAVEVTKKDLFKACESLFGADVDVSVEFLHYLKPSGVKAAFRKKALETHPDRAVILAGNMDLLERRFKEINLAYQLLQAFLSCPWKYSLDERGSIYRTRRNPVKPARKYAASAAVPKYSGRIPSRKLMFGQFLYYCGYIELTTLIKAVVWQRLQRPSLGSIAARWNWLNPDDVYDILRQRHQGEKFGECALRRGHISRYQLMALLNKQRMLQPQIGRYFVEQRIISTRNIGKLIDELKVHNRKFLFS